MMAQMTPGRFIANATLGYRARYRKLFGLGFYEPPEYSMPRADHAFIQGPFLVSRPYPVCEGEIKELLDWSEKYGLRFSISGQSSWHPWTIVVRAVRPEWAQEFRKKAVGYGDAFELAVSHRLWKAEHADMIRVKRPSPRWEHGVESGVYVLSCDTGPHTRREIESTLSPIKPFFLGRYE